MAILGDTKATSLVVSGTSTLASINANSTGLGTNGQILKSTGTGIAWADPAGTHNHDSVYVNVSGDTMTGALLVGTKAMTVSAGKITEIATGQTGLFKDGIAISNPATKNDAGWIRVTGTGESDTVMEIATGDDAGAGEKIVARQYNTSNAVANELVLLNTDGGTVVPKRLTMVSGKPINQILTGSGTHASDAGASANPRYFPAKWTFNTGLNVADGDIFTIRIPVSGHDYGVFMSVDNGSHYYPVVSNGTDRLTTQYNLNDYIQVIFESHNAVANVFPVAGGNQRTSVSGGTFTVLNYYNSNTTYSAMSVVEMRTGTATSSRTMRADHLKTFLSTLGGTALTLTHNAMNGLVLNHDDYVTAGTAGTSSATSGITLAVPYVTYNAQGHITEGGTHTHTIPDASTSAKGVIQIGTEASNAAAGNHAHGNITNAGAIGTAANKGVYTGTNGVLTAGTIPVAAGGTGAATAADARTNLGITPANIGAATSGHNHDSVYVNVSGDTMTGGLTLSSGSGAYNDKGIIFTHGSRIGENGAGDLGIYAADGLYIKPSSPTTSSETEGIRITSNGLYPCVTNTESLGLSNYKWSNVYATTFTGNLNGVSNGGIYLVSSTVAATAAKTASYTGFTLLTGSNIYIIFNETNTTAEPTLNVNSTGAKLIYYKGVRVTYQGIATGILYHMIYDGTNWQIVNNITPQMGTCSTGAGTTAKTATCPGFVPYIGASFKVKFTVTNTILAPTLNINSTGAKPVNWIGATNDVKHRLLENHVYEFVYDGTNYNIVAPTIRHYATSGTAGTEGSETIAIGNSETTTEDGNLRGKILLYGTSSNYTTIMAHPNGNNNVYLPYFNGTMYLTHAGDTDAVGASTKPVYVAANGRVTQCSTIGSVTNEVWNVNFS